MELLRLAEPSPNVPWDLGLLNAMQERTRLQNMLQAHLRAGRPDLATVTEEGISVMSRAAQRFQLEQDVIGGGAPIPHSIDLGVYAALMRYAVAYAAAGLKGL
jgi:hypothetical protein